MGGKGEGGEGEGGKAEGGRAIGGKAEGGPSTTESTRASESAGQRVDAGAAWGSLVHGLLEHAARHRDATREDLRRLAGWLTVETPELRPVIPDALNLVERIVGASFWNEAHAGGDVDVEVPFAVRIPAGESLGTFGPVALPTVVHGVIDLVYRGADGWRILDYKTDQAAANDSVLLERYGGQLAQYRSAWERVSGGKVGSTGLVALRTMRTIWSA